MVSNVILLGWATFRAHTTHCKIPHHKSIVQWSVFISYLQFISDINGALNALNFCVSWWMYSVCLFVWNLLSTETIIVLFNYPHSIIIINGVYLLQGEFFHVLWQILSNDIWCIAIIIIFTIEQGTRGRESGREGKNDDGWMAKRMEMKGIQLEW